MNLILINDVLTTKNLKIKCFLEKKLTELKSGPRTFADSGPEAVVHFTTQNTYMTGAAQFRRYKPAQLGAQGVELFHCPVPPRPIHPELRRLRTGAGRRHDGREFP